MCLKIPKYGIWVNLLILHPTTAEDSKLNCIDFQKKLIISFIKVGFRGQKVGSMRLWTAQHLLQRSKRATFYRQNMRELVKYHLNALLKGTSRQHLSTFTSPACVFQAGAGLKPATSQSCVSSLQAAAGPDSNSLVFSLVFSRGRNILCVN